jgi:hypothetical protein
VGFVVTPSSSPVSYAELIIETSAVSKKIFIKEKELLSNYKKFFLGVYELLGFEDIIQYFSRV